MESADPTEPVTPKPPVLSVPPPLAEAPPPLEPKPDPPRPWGFWLTIVFGICISGVYLIPQVVVLIVVAILDGSISDPKAMKALGLNGMVVGIGMCVATPVTLAVCGLFAWLRRGLAVSDYLGFRRVSWKVYLASLLMIIVFGVVFALIASLLERPDVAETMLHVYRTAGFAPLIWVAMVVAAPLVEEVLFRGFLFKGFEHSPVGGAGAVILTALLWAAIHMQYDLFDMTVIFAMGLLFGVVRLRTGSLLPVLFMHMLNNLFATIQVVLILDAESSASALL